MKSEVSVVVDNISFGVQIVWKPNIVLNTLLTTLSTPDITSISPQHDVFYNGNGKLNQRLGALAGFLMYKWFERET